MSFVHFLLQVRTIKCDLDSIFEHDSLQQPCTGLKFVVRLPFLHLVCGKVMSVTRGGGGVPGPHAGCLVPEGVCSWGGVPAPGEGGSHSLGGCPGPWGECPLSGDPLPRRLLLRAVRILLECILVYNISVLDSTFFLILDCLQRIVHFFLKMKIDL